MFMDFHNIPCDILMFYKLMKLVIHFSSCLAMYFLPKTIIVALIIYLKKMERQFITMSSNLMENSMLAKNFYLLHGQYFIR